MKGTQIGQATVCEPGGGFQDWLSEYASRTRGVKEFDLEMRLPQNVGSMVSRGWMGMRTDALHLSRGRPFQRIVHHGVFITWWLARLNAGTVGPALLHEFRVIEFSNRGILIKEHLLRKAGHRF